MNSKKKKERKFAKNGNNEANGRRRKKNGKIKIEIVCVGVVFSGYTVYTLDIYGIDGVVWIKENEKCLCDELLL